MESIFLFLKTGSVTPDVLVSVTKSWTEVFQG